MKIKHYEIPAEKIETDNKWKSSWYCLSRLREVYSAKAWQVFKDAQEEAHKLGVLGERELEVDLFLSILSEIKNNNITFIELGAGYADWCLAVNGVVRNKLIKTNIQDIECYAIEAEPQHIKWAKEHFKYHKINGKVVPFVITDKNGRCDFAIDNDPASSYGQSQKYTDGLIRTLGNIVRRKTISVPCMMFDSLMKAYQIKHVDLVDMDVQGNEVRVIDSAYESIQRGKIDYWKIGTHNKKYNDKLKKLLTPYYDLMVDVYPNSIGGINGLKAKVEDGIQVYKRKGLK